MFVEALFSCVYRCFLVGSHIRLLPPHSFSLHQPFFSLTSFSSPNLKSQLNQVMNLHQTLSKKTNQSKRAKQGRNKRRGPRFQKWSPFLAQANGKGMNCGDIVGSHILDYLVSTPFPSLPFLLHPFLGLQSSYISSERASKETCLTFTQELAGSI